MGKIRIDNFGGLEFEPATDRAKEIDRYMKERMGDTSVLESKEGQQAKAVREKMFNEAYGQHKESSNHKLTAEEVKTGKDLREKIFNEALGLKPEKKAGDEKKPFADLRKELKELSESLKAQGLTYFPLTEFQTKLEEWSADISLKESGADDLEKEFSRVKKIEFRGCK